MKVLLLALFSAAAVSRGWTWTVHHPGGRIYDGEMASEGEIPYQVSVFEEQDFICGGSIISNNWVVTAAHCFLRETVYSVRAGSLQLFAGGTTHKTVSIIKHPEFTEDNNAVPNNDIALLKVDPPITFSKNATFIHLADESTPTPAGKEALVSGWGRTETGIVSPVLLKVSLTICSVNECDKILMGLAPNQICAWSPFTNKDACEGDSGGPLAIDGILHGIVSWGELTCGIPGVPGAYTEVSAYRKWIESITGF